MPACDADIFKKLIYEFGNGKFKEAVFFQSQ